MCPTQRDRSKGNLLDKSSVLLFVERNATPKNKRRVDNRTANSRSSSEAWEDGSVLHDGVCRNLSRRHYHLPVSLFEMIKYKRIDMEIFHKLDDVLFKSKTLDELKTELEELYTLNGVRPLVEIMDNDIVRVVVDTNLHDKVQSDMERALSLCNQHRFQDALPILNEVVRRCPLHSEAWRTLAQIHWLEQGEADKAFDELIESLRSNPKNMWALILMGNLISKVHNDPATAERYYRNVLEYYPDNAIALNNVAGVYMERKDYDAAIPLFEKVLGQEKSYANSYYGLALCYYKKNEFERAFEVCHEGALNSKDRPEDPAVRQELLKLYLTVAGELSKRTNYMHVWLAIRDELQEVDGRRIEFVEDPEFPLSAQMEYSVTHGKDHHVIRYNPEKPYVDHLFMHELMHLRMAQLATKVHRGKVLIETSDTRRQFNEHFGRIIRKMHPNISGDKIEKFVVSMRRGIGQQLLSGPLDLFVEQLIYDKYPVARPVQLLSLFHMEQENLESVRTGEKSGAFPKDIVHTNKVINMCTSMHFKEMYGINLLGEYHPTKKEMEQATDLFEEFKAYRNTFKDGDEYEMMEYFVESFGMQDIVEVADEREAVRIHAEKIDEPMVPQEGIGPTDDEVRERNAEFAENHPDGGDPGETMMMAMYMVGAMEYFDTLDRSRVQMIAMEIATVGQTGIDPKKTYSIPAIPKKEFGGYQFLAYYYVSFARAFPEVLNKLGLPFKTAYEQALMIYNKKK